MALRCRDRADELKPREKEFLDTICRYARNLTEKQLKWLGDISKRLGFTNG
jgi:hypothetical protein